MANYLYKGSGKNKALNNVLKILDKNPNALDKSGFGDKLKIEEWIQEAKKKKKKKSRTA